MPLYPRPLHESGFGRLGLAGRGPTGGKGGTPPLSPLSPGNRPKGMSVEQWANMQASKLINAQVSAINEAKRLYLKEINDQADSDRAKYDSLARGLQGMNFPGQIQGIYGGAAQNIQGLAGAMAAGQTANTNALGAQNQNMVSGTGQEGSLASQGGILGEVTYGTEGIIPGQTYGDVGKGFAAQAALEPGFALQIGYGDVQKEKSEAMKGLKDFMLQIAEAKSQRPSLQMELASARRGEQAESLNAERDWRMKLAALYMSQGKFDLAKEQMVLSQQNTLRDDKRADLAESRQAAKDQLAEWKVQGLGPDGKTPLPSYHKDPKTGQIVKDGWHINKKGIPVKNAGSGTSGSTSSTVPGTPAYNAAALQDVGQAADNIEKDIAAWLEEDGDLLRPQVAKRLLQKYDHLRTTPSAKKRLRKLIESLLDGAGVPKKYPMGPPAPGSGDGGDDDEDNGGPLIP